MEFESAGPVLAGGMRGYELVGHGKDRGTGRALVIYQLLLAVPNGFVLVQGRANAVDRDVLLPRMRSAARSVRRRVGPPWMTLTPALSRGARERTGEGYAAPAPGMSPTPRMSTSRGLAPSAAPTTPSRSMRSIMRAARL